MLTVVCFFITFIQKEGATNGKSTKSIFFAIRRDIFDDTDNEFVYGSVRIVLGSCLVATANFFMGFSHDPDDGDLHIVYLRHLFQPIIPASDHGSAHCGDAKERRQR